MSHKVTVLVSHHASGWYWLTTRFKSGEELTATLRRYVYLDDQQIPRQALGHHPPIYALKEWQTTHPHLFNKQVKNRPGRDT